MSSRRNSITSNVSISTQSSSSLIRNTSIDHLMGYDDKFTKKAMKKTIPNPTKTPSPPSSLASVSIPSSSTASSAPSAASTGSLFIKQQGIYYFPNGEVFRPRNSTKKPKNHPNAPADPTSNTAHQGPSLSSSPSSSPSSSSNSAAYSAAYSAANSAAAPVLGSSPAVTNGIHITRSHSFPLLSNGHGFLTKSNSVNNIKKMNLVQSLRANTNDTPTNLSLHMDPASGTKPVFESTNLVRSHSVVSFDVDEANTLLLNTHNNSDSNPSSLSNYNLNRSLSNTPTTLINNSIDETAGFPSVSTVGVASKAEKTGEKYEKFEKIDEYPAETAGHSDKSTHAGVPAIATKTTLNTADDAAPPMSANILPASASPVKEGPELESKGEPAAAHRKLQRQSQQNHYETSDDDFETPATSPSRRSRSPLNNFKDKIVVNSTSLERDNENSTDPGYSLASALRRLNINKESAITKLLNDTQSEVPPRGDLVLSFPKSPELVAKRSNSSSASSLTTRSELRRINSESETIVLKLLPSSVHDSDSPSPVAISSPISLSNPNRQQISPESEEFDGFPVDPLKNPEIPDTAESQTAGANEETPVPSPNIDVFTIGSTPRRSYIGSQSISTDIIAQDEASSLNEALGQEPKWNSTSNATTSNIPLVEVNEDEDEDEKGNGNGSNPDLDLDLELDPKQKDNGKKSIKNQIQSHFTTQKANILTTFRPSFFNQPLPIAEELSIALTLNLSLTANSQQWHSTPAPPPPPTSAQASAQALARRPFDLNNTGKNKPMPALPFHTPFPMPLDSLEKPPITAFSAISSRMSIPSSIDTPSFVTAYTSDSRPTFSLQEALYHQSSILQSHQSLSTFNGASELASIRPIKSAPPTPSTISPSRGDGASDVIDLSSVAVGANLLSSQNLIEVHTPVSNEIGLGITAPFMLELHPPTNMMTPPSKFKQTPPNPPTLSTRAGGNDSLNLDSPTIKSMISEIMPSPITATANHLPKKASLLTGPPLGDTQMANNGSELSISSPPTPPEKPDTFKKTQKEISLLKTEYPSKPKVKSMLSDSSVYTFNPAVNKSFEPPPQLNTKIRASSSLNTHKIQEKPVVESTASSKNSIKKSQSQPNLKNASYNRVASAPPAIGGAKETSARGSPSDREGKPGFKKFFKKIFHSNLPHSSNGLKKANATVGSKISKDSSINDSFTSTIKISEREEEPASEPAPVLLPSIERDSGIFDDMLTHLDERFNRSSMFGSASINGSTLKELANTPFLKDDELTAEQVADQKEKDQKSTSLEDLNNSTDEDFKPLPVPEKRLSLAHARAALEDIYIDDNILFLRNEVVWMDSSTGTNNANSVNLHDFNINGNIIREQVDENGEKYINIIYNDEVGRKISITRSKTYEQSSYSLFPDGETETINIDNEQLNNVFDNLNEDQRRQLPMHLKYIKQFTDYDNLEITVKTGRKRVIKGLVPAKPSLRRFKYPPNVKRKSVAFGNKIYVNETYAPELYKRYNKLVTQYSLTEPVEINKIKAELNQYKCNEMLVHELSLNNTHFFY